jgi:uncharacterized membrane protein YdbT with pleckstrin-like domain
VRPPFLQAGEEPLLVQRRHLLSALDEWLGLLVAVAVVAGGAFVLAAFVPQAAPYAPGVAVAAAVLGLAAALAVWFRVSTSLSILTAERVYHAHGRLRFFLAQTTYDRVTDLHVRQSLFGRWFGFGTVLVQTAGHGVHLVGVRDPLATKRILEEAREAMVRRLVAEHGKGKARSAAAAAPGRAAKAPLEQALASAEASDGAPQTPWSGDVGWLGRPTAASVVAQVLPMAATLVALSLAFGPGVLERGPYGFLLPVVLLLILSAMAARAAVQYGTTRYEVHPWGVAVATGWLSRSRIEARYEKVTDVAVTQGLLGRLLGFGTIRINTAGGNEAPVTFAGVPSPDEVKARIDLARRDGSA